jgi:hypothetical protein
LRRCLLLGRSSFSFSPNNRPLVTSNTKQRSLTITPGKTRNSVASTPSPATNARADESPTNRRLAPILPPNFGDGAGTGLFDALVTNSPMIANASSSDSSLTNSAVAESGSDFTASGETGEEATTEITPTAILSATPPLDDALSLRRNSTPSPTAAMSSRRRVHPPAMDFVFVFGWEDDIGGMKKVPQPSPNEENVATSVSDDTRCENSAQEVRSKDKIILATTEVAAKSAIVEGIEEKNPPSHGADSNNLVGNETQHSATADGPRETEINNTENYDSRAIPRLSKVAECDAISPQAKIQFSLSNPNFKSPKKFSLQCGSPLPYSSGLTSSSSSSPMILSASSSHEKLSVHASPSLRLIPLPNKRRNNVNTTDSNSKYVWLLSRLLLLLL